MSHVRRSSPVWIDELLKRCYGQKDASDPASRGEHCERRPTSTLSLQAPLQSPSPSGPASSQSCHGTSALTRVARHLGGSCSSSCSADVSIARSLLFLAASDLSPLNGETIRMIRWENLDLTRFSSR